VAHRLSEQFYRFCPVQGGELGPVECCQGFIQLLPGLIDVGNGQVLDPVSDISGFEEK